MTGQRKPMTVGEAIDQNLAWFMALTMVAVVVPVVAVALVRAGNLVEAAVVGTLFLVCLLFVPERWYEPPRRCR